MLASTSKRSPSSAPFYITLAVHAGNTHLPIGKVANAGDDKSIVCERSIHHTHNQTRYKQ
jgi:hypothetical protein